MPATITFKVKISLTIFDILWDIFNDFKVKLAK